MNKPKINLRNIKVFGFDWSGTISDDRMPVYLANMELLRLHKKPVMTFDEWLYNTKASAYELMVSYGVEIETEKAQRLYKEYLDKFICDGFRPKVYPGVFELFKYLKDNNKKIFVISTHPTQNLKEEAKEYGLISLIDFIEGDIKDKCLKLREICEIFCVLPDKVLYAGDSIYDVVKANEAGICSAAIYNGYHKKEKFEAEGIIPSIEFSHIGDMINFLSAS